MPCFNGGHSGNRGLKVVEAIEGLSYGPTTLYPYFSWPFVLLGKIPMSVSLCTPHTTHTVHISLVGPHT